MEKIKKLQAISEWLNHVSVNDFSWLRNKHMTDWEYVSEERWQMFLSDVDEVLYRLRIEASRQLRNEIDSANPKMKRLFNDNEQ